MTRMWTHRGLRRRYAVGAAEENELAPDPGESLPSARGSRQWACARDASGATSQQKSKSKRPLPLCSKHNQRNMTSSAAEGAGKWAFSPTHRCSEFKVVRLEKIRQQLPTQKAHPPRDPVLPARSRGSPSRRAHACPRPLLAIAGDFKSSVVPPHEGTHSHQRTRQGFRHDTLRSPTHCGTQKRGTEEFRQVLTPTAQGKM